jgi:hypothetical protein
LGLCVLAVVREAVPVLGMQGLLQMCLHQCTSCLQLLNSSCKNSYLEPTMWWADWSVELSWAELLVKCL